MGALLAAIAVTPILPGLGLLALLRRMRRAGHPDPAAERVLAVWLLYAVTNAVLTLAWPGAPPWLWIALLLPVLAAGFRFLAARIRQHPEALFSPAAIRRSRSCKGHR